MDKNNDYFDIYLKNYTKILGACMLLFGIYYLLVIKHYFLAINALIFVPVCFLVPKIYQKIQSRLICANLTLFMSFYIVTTIIICTGGINSWVLTWYIIGPILSGLLGGTKSIYFWGGFVLCAIVGLHIFDPYIQGLPYQITDPEILASFKIRSLIVPMLFSILLTSLYLKLMNRWGDEVENKNKSIRNLLRLVSHDIANPLTVISGMSHIQFKKQEDPESKEYRVWKKMSMASTTIRKILDQVRQMQAIESGKMDVPLSPVSLKKVFDKGIFIFQDKLEKKNIKLTFESPEDDISVMAEETSFSNQVVNNILSNAIKFSHDNDTITIKVEPRADLIYLIIRDQGIGIPPEILVKLFDENAKTSRKGVAGEEGTGFGMPLVKFFMDKYGGEIKVQSVVKSDAEVNHGTEFTLILQRAS